MRRRARPAGRVRRRGPAWCLAVVALLGAGLAAPVRGEVLLFRGAHVYVVPGPIATAMLEAAPREAWRLFPDLTRQVDVDGDGRADYVAIALGARGGLGAQIRYRLHHDATGPPRLGRWYWAVVLAPDGSRLAERFNP